MSDWVSYLNKHYIETYSPEVKVFKLDKVATELSPIYNEEKHTRIYLPPFNIKALHLTNYIFPAIGTNFYSEKDDKEMQFVFNFEHMVQIINDLKKNHLVDIYLSYLPITTSVTCSKQGNIFTVKKNGAIIFQQDISNNSYNTIIKLLGALIYVDSGFTYSMEGKNDISSRIVSFNETNFTGKELNFYIPDTTYDNSTEVIEMGDLILTNKWRLYQANSVKMAGDFGYYTYGWDYTTYIIKGDLINIDQANLPGDYKKQIIEHYEGKINKE